jgi:hypothetical protein
MITFDEDYKVIAVVGLTSIAILQSANKYKLCPNQLLIRQKFDEFTL